MQFLRKFPGLKMDIAFPWRIYEKKEKEKIEKKEGFPLRFRNINCGVGGALQNNARFLLVTSRRTNVS